MNFLQSPIWREIQTLVGRDIFDVQCGDQTYRGTRRTRHVWLLRLHRYQVLGVEDVSVLACLEDYANRYYVHWNDIFFQVGVVQEITSFDLVDKRSIDPMVIWEERNNAIVALDHWKMSRKENMPLATIVTPLVEEQELYDSYHKEHRRMIRKAREQWFTLTQATTQEQWKAFYDVWSSMGEHKGVGIMTRESFVRVMEYVTSEGVWSLFLLIDGDVVTAGSLVMWWEWVMYYIYGASNREYHNSGAHVLLQHEIMSWWYGQWYSSFDHRGVAPISDPDHHLAGVSRFKERFGWIQKEFVGSIDYINNGFLYRLMQRK